MMPFFSLIKSIAAIKKNLLGIGLFACQIFFLHQSLSATIDLSLYAGSYHSFSEDNKALSPINGVIYYHRIIRGIYLEKKALGKLCKKLFYCIHDNGRELCPTKNRNKTVTHLTPHALGALIATTERFRLAGTGTPELLKKMLYNQISSDDAYKNALQQTKLFYEKNNQDALAASFEKDTQKELISFVNHFVNACYATGLLHKESKNKKKQQSILTLKHTPYYLLQAFVYRKYTTKNDLADFCQVLGAHLPNNIKGPQDVYEQAVFDLLGQTKLPAIDDSVEAECSIQGHVVRFADCMEHVMRHLFHMLAYDPEEKKFDSDRLHALSSTGTIHPGLESYFSQFPTPACANTQAAHNAWAALLSNQPGLSYAEFYNPATQTTSRGLFYHEHLLSQSIIMENDTYEPAPAGALLYELDISLHNIIVIMHELLQLNFFNLQDQTFLRKVFFTDEFVNRYFEKLNNLLGSLYDQEVLFKKSNFNGREIILTTPLAAITLYPHTHAKICAQEITSLPPENTELANNMLYRLLRVGINKHFIWETMNATCNRTPHDTLFLTELARAYYHNTVLHGINEEEIQALLQVINRCNEDNAPSHFFLHLYKKIEKVFEKEFFRHMCEGGNQQVLPTLYTKEKMRGLIDKPLNDHNDTALMITSTSGNNKLTEKFIDLLADDKKLLKKVLTQKNHDTFSVVMIAAKFNNLSALETIFKQIACEQEILEEVLTQQHKSGATALIFAARLGYPSVVTLILTVAKNCPYLLEKILTQYDAYGSTALKSAAESGYESIIEIIITLAKTTPELIEKIILHQDHDGNNVMMGASDAIVSLLLNEVPNKIVLEKLLKNHNKDHDTVLIKAARLGYLLVVQVVLDHTKNYPELLEELLTQEGKNGETALIAALVWSRMPVIECIVNRAQIHHTLLTLLHTQKDKYISMFHSKKEHDDLSFLLTQLTLKNN